MRFSITLKLLLPLIIMFSLLTWSATSFLLGLFIDKQLSTTQRYISDVATQAAMQFDVSVGEEALKRILTGIAIGDHIVQAAVVDPMDNSVIASSLYRYADHNIHELPSLMQDAFVQNQSDNAYFTDILNGHYAMSLPVTVLTPDFTGTRRLVLLFYLDTIIIENDYADYRQQVLIVAGVFLVVLLFLLSLLVNYLVRNPLSRFEQAINVQSSTGQLQAVDVRSKDELGDIAMAFNRFIEQEQTTLKAHRDAVKAAESLANKKTQFLANMSHEIRTPLNGIIGLTQLCQQTQDPDQIDDYLKQLTLSSQLMLSLVNDILDFSRLTDSELSLQPEYVDLEALLEGVVPVMSVLAQKKGLELRVNKAPDCPVEVELDRLRAQQILINLINNAIKFTVKGSVSLSVEFEWLNDDSGTLQLIILDTGIGIKPQDIERLFDPFEQVDTSSSRDFGGTGLGLAICQKLVELMQGHISVKSTINKGSAFTVKLPCQAKRIGERTIQPAVKVDASNEEKRVGNILVAEDNDINAVIVRDMLKSLGHNAILVENGEMAVNAALSGKFDVVLMDIQMPVMDGLEATQRIRQNGFSKPILGLSANVFEEDRENALNSGMNDYLHKPIVLESLSQKLQLWLIQSEKMQTEKES